MEHRIEEDVSGASASSLARSYATLRGPAPHPAAGDSLIAPADVQTPFEQRDAPMDVDERLQALDILRGLALFGMILVHFHQRMRLEARGVEDLIGWGVWILVEQKAWGTFAVLFGAGFAILLRRLEARGAPVAPTYLRRLAALAAFGVIAEVGFGFSILFAYACWGVVLFAIRKWTSRALLITAAVFASARPIAAELSAVYSWLTSTSPPPSSSAALVEAVRIAGEQSRYFSLLSARALLFVHSLPHSWRDVLPDSNPALFILGFLAVRRGVFDAPLQHIRLIVRWMTFGAIAWACSWLLLRHLPPVGIDGADWPLEYGLGLIQDQWLCLTYIGAVVLLLAYRPVWTKRLALFGYAGRMALTNYMLQIIVLDMLGSGYGAHLKLRPYLYVAATALLFAAEVAISRAWLARFRFGPLEWVWRMITYANVPELRRQAGAVTGVNCC
jgi:uncharacterized protein